MTGVLSVFSFLRRSGFNAETGTVFAVALADTMF